MQQEWKLYPFINATKKEYHDIYRKYNRPALSFQVCAKKIFLIIK